MKIMPNCREITEQASDYRDQALPFWKRVSFQLHLRMCAYCRQYAKNFDLTISTLNKIDDEAKTTKTDNTARIVEMMKQQAKNEKRAKAKEGKTKK